jgi:hypothetical protein
MKIYYRISNNSYNKKRLEFATKEYCLSNFLREFNNLENSITIIADNVTDQALMRFIKSCNVNRVEETSLNNAKSFKYILHKSIQDLSDNEFVFFAEDDYLYVPGSDKIIKEGLRLADYVSLYDHPDKYMNHSEGGDNPFIENGGEVTRVILSESTHWKLTNSTTMTFASTVEILKQDLEIWNKHLNTAHPNDFQSFLELREKGRSLITPIPGLSTHTEVKYLSPLVDWTKI